MPNVRNLPASDLARKTGDMLDAASRTPVAITRHRKPRPVPMSLEHHEMLTGKSDQKACNPDEMPAELKSIMAAALERDLTKRIRP